MEQLLNDRDQAYRLMRRLVPALDYGRVSTADLDDVQRDAVHRYEALAGQVRAARAATR